MRVMITGVAGFIGSTLADALLDAGHEVAGIDKARGDYLAKALLQNFEWFTYGDLATMAPSYLAALLEACDVVVHLAARASQGPSWAAFGDYEAANVMGTRNLLEALILTPRPLVHVSSSSVYGATAGEEGMPLNPISPYGVTKAAGEMLVRAYVRSYGLTAMIVRPFSIYGPRQRPDMLHRIVIGRLLRGDEIVVHGDGQQTRSFTYVDDLVQLLMIMVEKRATCHAHNGAHLTFNAAMPEAWSVLHTIDMLAELVGTSPRVRHTGRIIGDQAHTNVSANLARWVLCWRAVTPYREGLERQVAWQRDLFERQSGRPRA